MLTHLLLHISSSFQLHNFNLHFFEMAKYLFLVFSIIGVMQMSHAQLAQYGESCSPNSLLTPTYCRLYDRTVSCSKGFEGFCECNLGDDAVFDPDQELCVSKVDALCLTEPTDWGRKLCVKGADCYQDEQREGHTVGTCQCMTGYDATADRTCESNGQEPATMRPTTTRQPIFQTQSTTTVDPTRSTPTTTKKPDDGSDSGTVFASACLTVFSVLLVTLKHSLMM